MQHLMKTRTLMAAGSLALITALSACGGSDSGGGSGSDAPDNASTDDFCEAFNGLVTSVLANVDTADPTSVVKAIKEWAGNIEEVGTPSDMPDDARHGFEVFVEQAKNIDDDATLADLEALGQDVSSDDAKDSLAFSTWTTQNCPMDLPSGLPTDLASGLPSDLPTDFPSDLPTDPSELESMMSELTASAGS